MTIRDTYLIQRLDKPFKGIGDKIRDNPFSFGGGYKNGGLGKEAMDILRPIFSFDYMGSAEFEFGAVPEALSGIYNMAVDKALVGFEIQVPIKKVPKDYMDKSKEVPEGNAAIYVICSKDNRVEIMEVILQLALGKYKGHLKEGTNLPRVLRPYDSKYTPRTCGWLELDNGFFFFTDREMFEQIAAIFDVETGVTK